MERAVERAVEKERKKCEKKLEGGYSAAKGCFQLAVGGTRMLSPTMRGIMKDVWYVWIRGPGFV